MRFLLLSLALVVAPLRAQQSAEPTAPVAVSLQEAMSHRIGHDMPVYPRFALAAGIAGTVEVAVAIGPEGSVASVGDSTGPPALLASARDWTAATKFRPFVRDGQATAVSATLPVVFQLPPGSHSAHPLRAIYQRNVTGTLEREGRDGPPRVRWAALSPAMRDWLIRYEAFVAEDKPPDPTTLSVDDAIARQSFPQPLSRMPDNLTLYPIPLALRAHRLYLLFEFSSRCQKTNCPLAMIEESPSGVHALVAVTGVDVDLHRRSDSPYPDLLVWSDTAQSGISQIAGYSYYGGEWGQLYCGVDDAYEDSEFDEEAALHHGSGPRRPLVTLCK
jgi:TonB family protein